MCFSRLESLSAYAALLRFNCMYFPYKTKEHFQALGYLQSNDLKSILCLQAGFDKTRTCPKCDLSKDL